MSKRARVGFVGAALLTFGALLGGCVRVEFVRTNGLAPSRRGGQPEVFIDRQPAFAFQSIGILQVTAPAGTRLSNIIQRLIEEGTAAGCDVIVDRAIFRVAAPLPLGALVAMTGDGPLLAQYTPYTPAPVVMAPAPPPQQSQWICGVYAVPPPAAPAPPPAPAPAAPGPRARGSPAGLTPRVGAPKLRPSCGVRFGHSWGSRSSS